jgi:hypothetical protein
VWITTICTSTQEVLVVHRNAPLSETGRLRLARCVVDDGWPLRRAAERFQVSHDTAGRYRQLGAAGMSDQASRPHHSPRRTPARTERRIIKVRVTRRWGPARIGWLLGLPPSTVHRVLTRYGLAKLAWLDRGTGQVIRRYEAHTALGGHPPASRVTNLSGQYRTPGQRTPERRTTSCMRRRPGVPGWLRAAVARYGPPAVACLGRERAFYSRHAFSRRGIRIRLRPLGQAPSNGSRIVSPVAHSLRSWRDVPVTATPTGRTERLVHDLPCTSHSKKAPSGTGRGL